ncbi:recombinase family protein [Dyadobacter sp. CY343]|uniref:recombinase family protein n=1 Tax=Dyadobacter sp. CY343 TaxID=2907299 RepID=UPI001F428EBD|nr:recombinase family protein [Dyadobacter sp. CY343]MCE7061940.1 recombinase family protein [Dyadobacter sp. CY343]
MQFPVTAALSGLVKHFLIIDSDAVQTKNSGFFRIERRGGAEKHKKFYLQPSEKLGGAQLNENKLMVEWKEMGVDFRSISEGIDTSTKMGRLWYMLSSVFAENEREILMERTLAGMEAARARGRVGGRPKGLTKKSKELASLATTLYLSKKYTTTEICKQLKIGSKTTLYNYLRHEGLEIEGWARVKFEKE